MAALGGGSTGGGSGGGLPRLSLPSIDYSKIAELSQEQIAPTRAGLTRALQSVQAQRFGSPVARKQALRGAVRGAGESLGGAQAAATQTAYGLYRPEFEAKMEEAMERYRLQLEEDERNRQEKEKEKVISQLTRTPTSFPGQGDLTRQGVTREGTRPFEVPSQIGGLAPLPESIPSFETDRSATGSYSLNWAK